MTQRATTQARIERSYDAPAQAVFDAWTNPEVMKRFWSAGPDWDTPTAEADVSVGGALRVVMRQPTGESHGGSGEYTVVEPPERLAFTWRWDESELTSLVELAFSESDGVTTVVLTHSGLSDEESARRHSDGWTRVLQNLERALAA